MQVEAQLGGDGHGGASSLPDAASGVSGVPDVSGVPVVPGISVGASGAASGGPGDFTALLGSVQRSVAAFQTSFVAAEEDATGVGWSGEEKRAIVADLSLLASSMLSWCDERGGGAAP